MDRMDSAMFGGSRSSPNDLEVLSCVQHHLRTKLPEIVRLGALYGVEVFCDEIAIDASETIAREFPSLSLNQRQFHLQRASATLVPYIVAPHQASAIVLLGQRRLEYLEHCRVNGARSDWTQIRSEPAYAIFHGVQPEASQQNAPPPYDPMMGSSPVGYGMTIGDVEAFEKSLELSDPSEIDNIDMFIDDQASLSDGSQWSANGMPSEAGGHESTPVGFEQVQRPPHLLGVNTEDIMDMDTGSQVAPGAFEDEEIVNLLGALQGLSEVGNADDMLDTELEAEVLYGPFNPDSDQARNSEGSAALDPRTIFDEPRAAPRIVDHSLAMEGSQGAKPMMPTDQDSSRDDQDNLELFRRTFGTGGALGSGPTTLSDECSSQGFQVSLGSHNTHSNHMESTVARDIVSLHFSPEGACGVEYATSSIVQDSSQDGQVLNAQSLRRYGNMNSNQVRQYASVSTRDRRPGTCAPREAHVNCGTEGTLGAEPVAPTDQGSSQGDEANVTDRELFHRAANYLDGKQRKYTVDRDCGWHDDHLDAYQAACDRYDISSSALRTLTGGHKDDRPYQCLCCSGTCEFVFKVKQHKGKWFVVLKNDVQFVHRAKARHAAQ